MYLVLIYFVPPFFFFLNCIMPEKKIFDKLCSVLLFHKGGDLGHL